MRESQLASSKERGREEKKEDKKANQWRGNVRGTKVKWITPVTWIELLLTSTERRGEKFFFFVFFLFFFFFSLDHIVHCILELLSLSPSSSRSCTHKYAVFYTFFHPRESEKQRRQKYSRADDSTESSGCSTCKYSLSLSLSQSALEATILTASSQVDLRGNSDRQA